MNRIDFTVTGGFPFDQSVLKFLQDETVLLQNLAGVFGPLIIVSGCEVAGANAAPGTMLINGEILPFAGGAIAAKVIIVETPESLTYEDGNDNEVVFTRIATFGDDGVQNNPWANFLRVSAEGLISRIETIKANQIADEAAIVALQTSKATKFYSGTLVVGDPGTSVTYNIVFPAALANTNYQVMLTLVSLGANPDNDLINTMAVRNKTINGFIIYLHEPSAMFQNINVDWMVIAK